MSCPKGTFSDQDGLYEQSQCQACPAGKYCHEEHQTTYTGLCAEGEDVASVGDNFHFHTSYLFKSWIARNQNLEFRTQNFI